jgi:hypothetical protein
VTKLRCYDLVDGTNFRQYLIGAWDHVQTNPAKTSAICSNRDAIKNGPRQHGRWLDKPVLKLLRQIEMAGETRLRYLS